MDPNLTDSLQTVAEISIALAGFTGIAGVISNRGGHAFSGPESFLLWTLLIVSGLLLFSSFLPSTVALLTDDNEKIWRWSFRCLLGSHIVAWLISIPFMRQSGVLLEQWPQPQRGIGFFFLAVGFSTVLVEASAVFAVANLRSPFVFQTLLLVLLLIAFASFVLLMV